MALTRLLVLCFALATTISAAQATIWKVVRDGSGCSAVASFPDETIRYLFATPNTPAELYIDGGPQTHTWKTDAGKLHHFTVDKDGHADIYADETMPNNVSWVDGRELPMGDDFDHAMSTCISS